MERLESLGSEKVKAIYAKRGEAASQFGVKMGDLRVVAKEIKTDHDLALQLWSTGCLDAMLLATLVITPKLLTPDQLDEMVRAGTNSQLADWLNSYVVKVHPQKEEMRVKWMASDNEMTLRSGWSLTAERVAKNPEGLDLPGLLDRIEKEMGSAHPMAQWTMNYTLAEIGINNPDLRARAVAIGEGLGVYRNYPCAKGCISPFAPIWIEEMSKRKG